MKRILFLSFLLIGILTLSAQERVIENPHFSVCTHGNVVVTKITLTDDATLLAMEIGHSPTSWIRIDSKTYIQVGDKKHIVESAEGIELDKEVFSDNTNKTSFVLRFPAIGPDAKTIDFLETDCEDCFKIWGLRLRPGETSISTELPQAINDLAIINEDGRSLEVQELNEGMATLKGMLLGYVPGMNFKIQTYVNNPLTGIQEELETKVEPDGTFEMKIPLVTTMEVLLRFSSFNKFILLSPGKESLVYIDLHQKSYQETSNKALRIPASKYVFWGGENADINNQMEDLNLPMMIRNTFFTNKKYTDILGMNASQFKEYTLTQLNDAIASLSDKRLTKRAMQFATISLRNEAAYCLFFAEYELREAYRRANNLSYEDEMTGFVSPAFDLQYYSYLKELDLNNPVNLYSASYGNNVNSVKYLRIDSPDDSRIEPAFYQGLIASGKLTPEEKETAQYLMDHMPETWDDEVKKRVEGFFSTYNDEIAEYRESRSFDMTKSEIAQVFNTSEGIVFDLVTTQTACRKFEDLMTLTGNDIERMKQLTNPFYLNYAVAKNNALLVELEENRIRNKDKKGYTVHDAPQTNGEQLFQDIIKPFEGKVILVDFWATWCGPCRMAMRQFESAKNQLKEQGVVFIYLTNDSSPLRTWENMIPDISGEHFRITNAQFDELSKLFGVKGIPSYLILNKNGEQVYFKVGFEGADKLSQLLSNELNK